MIPAHRTYASAFAFRNALDSRLRATLRGDEVQRRRQWLVFNRFLARMSLAFGDALVIKGGVVLEVRLEQARATQDIDVVLFGGARDLLGRLRAAAAIDLGDYMAFEIQLDTNHPEIVGVGVEYGGQRFKVVCALGDKQYGKTFGFDVTTGETLSGSRDVVVAEDLLGFVGVAPPTLQLISLETHIAEKLHAYTLPRPTPNSRVRDLPDLALLAMTAAVPTAEAIRAAIRTTFDARGSHPVPSALPEPPAAWEARYAMMAEEHALPWPTLTAVTAAARAFVDPVLGGAVGAAWRRAGWRWQ